MNEFGHDREDFHDHLLELVKRRTFIQDDISFIDDLTQYICEHERKLNRSVYLEQLLLAIDGPETVKLCEEYSKILFRIVNRTNLDEAPALTFRASVNLQVLLLWADHKGWISEY